MIGPADMSSEWNEPFEPDEQSYDGQDHTDKVTTCMRF